MFIVCVPLIKIKTSCALAIHLLNLCLMCQCELAFRMRCLIWLRTAVTENGRMQWTTAKLWCWFIFLSGGSSAPSPQCSPVAILLFIGSLSANSWLFLLFVFVWSSEWVSLGLCVAELQHKHVSYADGDHLRFIGLSAHCNYISIHIHNINLQVKKTFIYIHIYIGI